MPRILIIAPHFSPSNLAGVHRSRLFANNLGSFNWEPVVLTIDEKFYEEPPDWNLHKLLPAGLRIEKVNAFGLTSPRLIGDIGIRGFWQLYKRAKELISSEQIDFLFISIPSFYTALLGRLLHYKTGIRYGIDYIDPWVHDFPGSEKYFSRHWFSKKLASLLEPIAVKKASIITGVAEGYYLDVLKRNPHLKRSSLVGAMPYGGEATDHSRIEEIGIAPYLFEDSAANFRFVYAGAMLPKAYKVLEAVFQAIRMHPDEFRNTAFHFIGTGKTPGDENGYNIKPLAEKYGLWQSVIFEYPRRIPYLDVLVHLKNADAVFVLGSTEPHYTPSKVFQAVLSQKPLLAVLHCRSTAVDVVRDANAGLVLSFDGETEVEDIAPRFAVLFDQFKTYAEQFSPASVNMNLFEKYSAKNATRELVLMLNTAIGHHK